MDLAQANWKRRDQPVLSAMTTEQDWCRVTLYSPTVVRHGGRYLMWYLGNSSETRVCDMDLGFAESEDGLHWTPHPDNPILTAADLPSHDRPDTPGAWQTPHVLYDAEERQFNLWFVMAEWRRDAAGGHVGMKQRLGYATSDDGLSWDVHPELLYPSGRRPCVLKEGPNAYTMWMNSATDPSRGFSNLVANIYRFQSADGINWTRDAKPTITATAKLKTVIYPYVLKTADGYTMWYGAHVEDGVFELFCSTSSDGLVWEHHHDTQALPATRSHNHFDGRYTSTPCVLDDGDRYLLYYSARDWGNLYAAGDGTIKADGSGIYRHIGVAVWEGVGDP